MSLGSSDLKFITKDNDLHENRPTFFFKECPILMKQKDFKMDYNSLCDKHMAFKKKYKMFSY